MMSFLLGLALPIQAYAVPAAYAPGAFPELIEAGGSLTLEERGARAGLLSRQLTLR